MFDKAFKYVYTKIVNLVEKLIDIDLSDKNFRKFNIKLTIYNDFLIFKRLYLI